MPDNTLKKDFSNLRFQDFARMAKDQSLSKFEKIGFPDSYRKGFSKDIFKDILFKLPMLRGRQKKVLEIGPGCGELIQEQINYCSRHQHELHLIDNFEMLSLLSNHSFICKHPGFFPNEFKQFRKRHFESFDAIICYSVFQYIYKESDLTLFLETSLSLLKSKGRMLIGDIPNISLRNRFFKSKDGIKFHRKFVDDKTAYPMIDERVKPGEIDDEVILRVLKLSREYGCQAYVMPQNEKLPMANRREDILIIKP